MSNKTIRPIVDNTGWNAKPLNPYDGNYNPELYDEFEQANPSRPLTSYCEPGSEIEVREVREVRENKGDPNHPMTRIAYTPIKSNEVKEPAKVDKSIAYDCLDCGWQSSKKPDKIKCPDCGSIVYEHKLKQPIPAPSNELGSVETVEQAAKLSRPKHLTDDYRVHAGWYDLGFANGAQWQATQSPLDMVKVIEVVELHAKFNHIENRQTLIDELTTLISQFKK